MILIAAERGKRAGCRRGDPAVPCGGSRELEVQLKCGASEQEDARCQCLAYFNRNLDRYKEQLEALKYDPFRTNPTSLEVLLRPKQAVTFEDLHFVLLGPTAAGPPHGYSLLQPAPIPEFPVFPVSPPDLQSADPPASHAQKTLFLELVDWFAT
jgi:hypothetical protein